MGIFFDIFIVMALSFVMVLNSRMQKKINILENSKDVLTHKVDEIHRYLLSSRESLKDAKPIKPNNWDSVKEAFKGPVRINERN